MAQLTDEEILQRIVHGDVDAGDGVAALINRQTGCFTSPEGQLIDYKQSVDFDDWDSVAELSRDILGFSNSTGGVLILGVVDGVRTIESHAPVDFRKGRERLGYFFGTRVDFDMDEFKLTVLGSTQSLIVVTVRKSTTVYPNLLRKDIQLRTGFMRKTKYVSGTLFFREDSEIKAESPYGDIEGRARELGFTGAAPRTRTSFLLQEDKPGLRLYAQINDRFYGRQAELIELLMRFDDPRGRGISIAGFGGVGKTELAIKVVSELFRRGKFRIIYSGSAKQTLLGPGGAQQTDPVFIDLHSFLTDLAAWLGINPQPENTPDDLAKVCVAELRKYPKVLLFVDNLETVEDRSLLDFLDNKLPTNVWIVATGRVHRIRNFVYPKELREMDPHDGARLLRHELKRQGLHALAATEIAQLREKAIGLYSHPLAIRWFAWACRGDASVWERGIGDVNERELESFCVAHTLGNVDTETQKVLGAILAISGVTEATAQCIQHTSGVGGLGLERSLWELECSGLVSAVTDDDGNTTYSVAALADRPAAELAQQNEWEGEYVRNLRDYLKLRADAPPESPLVRDLIRIEPKQVRFYAPDELVELNQRLDRAIPRSPVKHVLKLKWLKAECERHLDHLVSADKLYKECAEEVLASGQIKTDDPQNVRLLIEAATVARARGQTTAQLERSISYLLPIQTTDIAAPRVLGMLTEMYAQLGDQARYEEFSAKAQAYLDEHTLMENIGLGDALERARRATELRHRGY